MWTPLPTGRRTLRGKRDLPDLVCDTSSIQYLHQLGHLNLLNKLGKRVLVPTAVIQELEVGRRQGVDLPDVQHIAWMEIVHPRGEKDTRLLGDMGPGETEVMMVALESDGLVAVIDDAMARRRAALLGLHFTGTLGILLDAKKRGMITVLRPLLDRLTGLGFHLAPVTQQMILGKSEEL